MPYPDIDPIIFQIGPIAVRWYALAYIAGLVFGVWYLRRLSRVTPAVITERDADDFLVWATLGVILGGRLGYIVFYQPGFYLENPGQMLHVWQGGMSFHGGCLGVTAAGLVFARKRAIPPLRFTDMLACVAPMGLFFGRLANFINGELVGRVTDVPWAVVFPGAGPLGRHPSQLYEAVLEGAVLFVVVNLLWRKQAFRQRPGSATGVFVAGYATARAFAELFRQPDAHLGFLSYGLTMGQLLSVPMLVFGVYLVFSAKPAR